MTGRVSWRGEEVMARVIEATKSGIDETTAACVRHAKQNHPWSNQTGTLEGSLRFTKAEGETTISGKWGSFDVNYALPLETGTRNMPAYPYLRPAADAEYPSLKERIRGRLM